MRIAFIGDVGGHADELYAALVNLGVDPQTYQMPPDLSVVQVGDLVNRGPDTPGVLSIIEKMIEQPGWTQLLGNHEALHLGRAFFHWPEVLSDSDQAKLESWWETGKIKMAAAVSTDEHSDLLVTHAGLTSGVWRKLGSPETAREAAAKINQEALKADSFVWREGVMVGAKTSFQAGTIWAEAGQEVISSWLSTESMPFGLLHGHSSAYWWQKEGFTVDPQRLESIIVDAEKRHVKARVHSREIIGVDPSFGTKAHPWEPLVLHGRVL